MRRSPSGDAEAPRRPAAGLGARAGAALLDGLAAVALAVPLAPSLGYYFAGRAVVLLSIGEPDTFFQGPVAMVLGIFGEIVFLLPATWCAIAALAPLAGATPGQWVVGLRVRSWSGRRTVPARRWLRFVLGSMAPWGTTLALVVGRLEVALVAWAAGALVALGALLALGPPRLTLVDRLTATAPVRNER